MDKSYYLKKHGYFLEDLKINQKAHYKKKISENDINLFSQISGDNNPIHMDDKFARSSIFKKRIAHGFLSGSLISTVIATQLPGPGSIYLNQSLKFLAPVFIGDTITTIVTIKEKKDDPKRPEFGIVVEACEIQNQEGKCVCYSEHVLLVERKKV